MHLASFLMASARTDTRDCINVASTIELKGLAFIAIPNKWIESFRGYSIAVGQMRCTGQGSMSMAPRGRKRIDRTLKGSCVTSVLPYMDKGPYHMRAPILFVHKACPCLSEYVKALLCVAR